MNFALAVGMFIVNWLVIPLVFGERIGKDSFCIGVIAATTFLILAFFVGL